MGVNSCFVIYDRGWVLRPNTDEEFLVLGEVLEHLENI